jgi:hypothetical protein
MFDGSGLSTDNYTATLIGWAGLGATIPQDVGLGAEDITYGSSAAAARTTLVDDHGWIISDGGPAE